MLNSDQHGVQKDEHDNGPIEALRLHSASQPESTKVKVKVAITDDFTTALSFRAATKSKSTTGT